MFKNFPLWLLYSFALAACSNDSSTSTDADTNLDPDAGNGTEAQADFYTPAAIKDALLLGRSWLRFRLTSLGLPWGRRGARVFYY